MDALERIEGRLWLYLIVLNVIVFILEQVTPTSNFIFSYGALSQSTAISMPWTWITTLFIHANVIHIAFNMWALFVFGPALERKVGTKYFLATYLAAGLLGNLGFLLTAQSATTVGIGASGAIYGVMAALAVLEPNLIVLVFFAPMPLWIAAILWFIIELVSTGSLDSIAHFAHVFGIVAGFIAGRYLKSKGQAEFEPLT